MLIQNTCVNIIKKIYCLLLCVFYFIILIILITPVLVYNYFEILIKLFKQIFLN